MEKKFSWGMTLPAIVLTVAGFLLAYQFVDPAPPNRFILSTGSAGGAYQAFAQRYRDILATRGIEVVLQPSAGSVENLERLRAGEADAALVQGGVDSTDGGDLLALGSLYLEPLWIFHRAENIKVLPDLIGKRLAVGPPGSGTRALALRLLEDNDLLAEMALQPLGGEAAHKALVAGEIDAAFFVASPQAPLIRTLLQDRNLTLFSFQRAEAYTRRLRYLSSITLPRGMVDMAGDLPAEDKTLVAATANLIVHPDLHPALQQILLQTASEVHRGGGWFERAGTFPNADFAEYPVSPEARRFYKYGPPLLQRYMPFWAATLLDRLKVMLLPLLMLMIPLIKVMPPLYTWRMRSRIYRWYQSLLQIDLESAEEKADSAALAQRAEALEQEVAKVHVPLSFAGQLYDLRQHIDLVKRRLRR